MSPSIQSEKKTGCDECVEDQLDVVSKNLPKYPFDEKYGRNIWKILAP